MALSTTGKLIAVGVVTAGVIGLSLAGKKARKTKKRRAKGAPLSDVYVSDALLPGVVADDVMLPISLSLEPRTVTTSEADIVGGAVNDPAQLGILITDINPERAQMAYEYMLTLVRDEGYDLSDPGTLDEAIKRTVSVIAPRVDWSMGLQPYAFTDPETLVWRGTQLLGELAHQSYWNKQAAPSA